ncbi:DNA primase small subunit PriS [Haladaptatus sp. CMSO5]|uniref:DNA primase small subunit PriS n=1 Tax=Haladaptatus sp. CMSO5 TaxID=3120514 RepID=UPI002FCE296C
MEERTRAYLRGRFRDYYRRHEITPPPNAHEREWGFIPWTDTPGTTMVRHRSLLDLGDLGEFLRHKRPRHVYFSAGQYADPSANSMTKKRWQGSDLVFDLDADHLPSVTLGEDSYAEMLEKCKTALMRLLSFLDEDFGFRDTQVVFSGGRGYHVHVRDAAVNELEREARREIVDYVRGIGLDFDELIATESVQGLGRKTPADKRTLRIRGGWGKRAHRHLMGYVDDVLDQDEEAALERLQSKDGVGEGRAKAALTAMQSNRDAIAAGNIDVHPAFYKIARDVMREVVDLDNAPIDEPVTTDTNRLIRLPGSLHGGSGLQVLRLERDELAEFDPLKAAVPDTFVGHDITVEVKNGGTVELGGDSFTLSEGDVTVPEYLGIFLMARGRAEKGKE